jgi:hypothetical protein
MVQRGDRPRFTLKPLACEIGTGEPGRQHLDGDLTVESCVARTVNLTHAAGADGRDDLVRAEAGVRGQGHSNGRSGSLAAILYLSPRWPGTR